MCYALLRRLRLHACPAAGAALRWPRQATLCHTGMAPHAVSYVMQARRRYASLRPAHAPASVGASSVCLTPPRPVQSHDGPSRAAAGVCGLDRVAGGAVRRRPQQRRPRWCHPASSQLRRAARARRGRWRRSRRARRVLARHAGPRGRLWLGPNDDDAPCAARWRGRRDPRVRHARRAATLRAAAVAERGRRGPALPGCHAPGRLHPVRFPLAPGLARSRASTARCSAQRAGHGISGAPALPTPCTLAPP